MVNSQLIKQMHSFYFLGYNLSYTEDISIDKEIKKFSNIYSMKKRELREMIKRDNPLKLYKVMAIPCGHSNNEA